MFGSFDPAIVELVEQVIQNNPTTMLFFMLKDELEIARSRTMLLQTASNLKRFEDIQNPNARERGEFYEIDDREIGYRTPSGETTPARIRFLLGDSSSRHDLLRQNEFDFVLEEMDQIGFIAEGREPATPTRARCWRC